MQILLSHIALDTWIHRYRIPGDTRVYRIKGDTSGYRGMQGDTGAY